MSVHLKKYFITGLLIWVPLVITLWVLDLLVSMMDRTLLLLPPSRSDEASTERARAEVIARRPARRSRRALSG